MASAAAVWVAPDGSAIKTEETNYGHCDQPLKQKKQITDIVCDWLMLFLHHQETFCWPLFIKTNCRCFCLTLNMKLDSLYYWLQYTFTVIAFTWQTASTDAIFCSIFCYRELDETIICIRCHQDQPTGNYENHLNQWIYVLTFFFSVSFKLFRSLQSAWSSVRNRHEPGQAN